RLSASLVGSALMRSFVLVLVVVLETVGTLIRGVFAQRLEGSRFGAHLATLAPFASKPIQPKHAKYQAAPGNNPA
ncbi:MAG: hypothetical protein WAK31_13415, partial [Chthoniobacterales bacterium]